MIRKLFAGLVLALLLNFSVSSLNVQEFPNSNWTFNQH